MKKIFFAFAIFAVLKGNAQNYLISFTGTGASGTVSTVKVENLTAGTSLTVNGDDILRLTGTVGINQVENRQSSEMKIYPNPMTDNSILQIDPPDAGNAIITVFDMAGNLVTQIQSYLENFRQEFRLSGTKNGLYLINVKGNNYQFSGKLLCIGKSNETINIEKISNNQAVDEKTSKMDYKGAQATVDMPYSTGNRLKFTGISGNYSTLVMDIPTQDKTVTFNFMSCTDGDNNNYPVIEINTQIWMAENLKTTKYEDGTNIPLVTDNTQWLNLITMAYCDYGNTPGNSTTYGKLYNWYAATDSRNVCPTGWHLPNVSEWSALTTYLGGESVAGGKLKETGTTHWLSPNYGATNESGFTALPGGYRGGTGTFASVRSSGAWWSSTGSTSDAWNLAVFYLSGVVYSSSVNKAYGFSVRCVKN
jgi:uncharacterized protein (TIGR02145 family)